MKNFSLVNPFITGSMTTKTEAKDELVAAKTLYLKLSKHFKNNVPRFNFSIKDDSDNLYHFEATERKAGKEVNFVIKPAKMTSANEKKMLKVVTKQMEEQEGGFGKKKKEKFLKHDDEDDDDNDDDDDESSSDDFAYSPRRVPYYYDYITSWLYTPQYVIDAVIPDTIVIDSPYYYYTPSLALDNGYIITYGLDWVWTP
jgi:hypothetical protein